MICLILNDKVILNSIGIDNIKSGLRYKHEDFQDLLNLSAPIEFYVRYKKAIAKADCFFSINKIIISQKTMKKI